MLSLLSFCTEKRKMQTRELLKEQIPFLGNKTALQLAVKDDLRSIMGLTISHELIMDESDDEVRIDI